MTSQLPSRVSTPALDESPLHRSTLHESGYRHSTGEALYVDDLPTPARTLVAWPVCSKVARGVITRLDVSGALEVPGVRLALTAEDIPGVNDISPFSHDEPLLASGEVFTTGQLIAVIVGDSYGACRAGAARVVCEIEERPALLSIEAADEAQSYHGAPHYMNRGDVEAALAGAPLRFSGSVKTGGQDHFYLETHAALVIPEEEGGLTIHSSTQHPSEVQAKVAEVLGISRERVVVEARRMGGGFGGKETQGAHYAALGALAATRLKRPVKVWLNRDQDMSMTGKRHPFASTFEAGFSKEGDLLALKVRSLSDGGWAADLSGAILDRCLFHLDGAYYIPSLSFEGRVAKTNLPSNTAFRGFGGPQGAVVMEEVMNQAAERLGLEPSEVKRRNFYGSSPRDMTPYHQQVLEDRSARIYDELISSSRYVERRQELEAWNAQHRWRKRGISYQPVKFGISFTASHLNQAGALVLIYADGGVQINHGGTEMGQGLHTKMLTVAAHELGVPVSSIRVMHTSTDKVPNTSATAASSGSDLNGQAVADACRTLRARLEAVAGPMLGVSEERWTALHFEGGWVYASEGAKAEGKAERVAFSEVTQSAYMQQISLSATGFYRTPDIHYDRDAGRGKPFHYFAYGAAVIEVEVCGFTGEHRVTRADILHDVGSSLVPSIDRGQIEGGFIQGLGWLTREELIFDTRGQLKTHSPDTYKIPSLGDAPKAFHVALLSEAGQEGVIHKSKAVGEPPFLLAIGVLGALRQAISSFRAARGHAEGGYELLIPCTPEGVLRVIEGKEPS